MQRIKKLFAKKTMTQDTLNTRISVMRTFLALFIGVAAAVVIIFLTSDSPAESARYLLLGPLMKKRYFYSMVVMWVPLIFTGLGVCLMFSTNQFNLFAEGAFFSGALVAAIVAVSFDLPGWLHPVVAILAATLTAGLLSMLPAYLQQKLGANIMVSTIMMNNIVLYVGLFLISTVFNDPTASDITTSPFRATARLREILPSSRITIGFFIAIVMVVVISLYMYRTRWGYNIRLIGKNPQFARYVGVNVGAAVIAAQGLGCALAGMGGAIEMLGVYSRFNWSGLPGQGWDGVTLAIIANNNPAYIPLAALFLAYLRQGADLMSIKTGLETDLISIVQAVILIFLLANKLLQKYKNAQTLKLSKQLNEELEAQHG